MTTLNKTEVKAINEMIQSGFTFYGDAIFTTFKQAKRCIDGLVRKGYAEKFDNEFRATPAAQDFVKYGI
jgi:hypothetical protein